MGEVEVRFLERQAAVEAVQDVLKARTADSVARELEEAERYYERARKNLADFLILPWEEFSAGNRGYLGANVAETLTGIAKDYRRAVVSLTAEFRKLAAI